MQLRKIAILGALFAASTSFAFADTVSLGSFATGITAASLGFSASQTAMNFAGFTGFATPPAIGSTPAIQNGIASTSGLSPNGVWGVPSGNSTWVGVAAGGPGGTGPALGYYQFTTQFSAQGGTYSGLMSVMADDTAEILLNGAVLVPFASLGSDLHCSDTGINCITPDLISLSGVSLLAGSNTLTFIVEQAGIYSIGNDPSGVNFTASLVRAVAPEPASLLLLGTGLLGAAGIFLRRRADA